MFFRKKEIICLSTVSILFLGVFSLVNNQLFATGDVSEYQEIINSLYNQEGNLMQSETVERRLNRQTVISNRQYKYKDFLKTQKSLTEGFSPKQSVGIESPTFKLSSLSSQYDEHDPIYIESDEEFVNQGYPGSGTIDDPYRIEGFSFASWDDNLITISGTSVYFYIGNNLLDGLYSGFNAIQLFDVTHGTIENNIIKNSATGVYLSNSRENYIRENEIFNNEFGIYLENKAGMNFIRSNSIYNNNEGIYIFNDPYSVLELWPNQHIFATDSDSIIWKAIWFEMYSEFPIEEVHDDLLQVSLTVDGYLVDASFSEVYFDGEQWCFDISYLSDPLSVGDHEFASQFVLAGETLGEPIAYVTVISTPFMRNFIIFNMLFDNHNGIHLQNSNDNIIGVNTLINNYGEGIGVYGSSENRIVWNQIEQSGMKGIMVAHDFGWNLPSEFNTIANNTIFGGAEDGISLEWVCENVVEDNELFGNEWAGIRLFGTSSYNSILDNIIHDNRGGGIAFESYSEVHMRFWQNITATEADHISWQVTGNYEDVDQAWYEHDNLETLLTVDGELVDVWYSEVYWDDWGDPENPKVWHFDGYYYSEPLPVGKHEFVTRFVLDGVPLEEYTTTAIVTVLPATDENYISHNYIAGNEIFSNEWSGIYVWKTYQNHITENQIYQHNGDGIYLEDSTDNIVDSNIIFGNNVGIGVRSANSNILTNNEIFDNFWNGIDISGVASENSITENLIHNNGGAGICLDSYSDVFMRFWQDITATEADYISWQMTWGYVDKDQALYNHSNLETLLTVDGELVDVWYSEVYWDDWGDPEWPYQWHFNVDYFSDPLPVGEHEFVVQCILEGEIILEHTAYVTIIPATDEDYVSHNYLSGNEIFGNEWGGIFIMRSHYNMITQNQIIDNIGCGIELLGSHNIISENCVSGNGFEGIRLSGDDSRDIYSEFNTIECNEISGNGQTGINLDSANYNLVVYNEISEHPEVGIGLGGKSSNNILLENVIYNNWNGGISLDSYSEVQMRYREDITATEVDYISWQVTLLEPEYDDILYWYNSLVAELTIDGEVVDIWYSEIYYDEEWQQWRYDINYYSDPLPIGDHEFTTEFFIEGVLREEWTATAIVSVLPVTDDDYASHNSIVNNEIFSNGWTGINIWRAHKNYISQNIISENGFAGILLDTSSYNILDMNVISYNSEQGIWIGNSEFNELTNSYISSNGADSGLNLYHCSNHLVSGNTITENMFGILLEESDSNRIIGNIVSDNYETGIQLMGTSSGNTIDGNIIHRNGVHGIAIDSYTEVHMRYGQDITATEVDYISWQITIIDPTYDGILYWYNSLEVELTVDGESVDIWHSEIYYDEGWEQWRYDIDYYSDPLSVRDHEFTTQFYLDGVLQEAWTKTAIVSVLPATDDDYASHNYIANNEIYSNVWAGIGFWRANKNSIVRNTINECAIGIYLRGSTVNLIKDNVVFENSMTGIVLTRESNFNEVKRNFVNGNNLNGIVIAWSNTNQITRNYIQQNMVNGIILIGSDHIKISRNIVVDNYEAGILLEESSENSIRRNVLKDNSNAGIALISGSHDNRIFRNLIQGSYFGILLDSSNKNHISRNVVYNNDEGICLSYSSSNRLSRNFVFFNSIGIHLIGSSDTRLSRNKVFHNDIDILEEP
ncbi:MAG: right-handed parallel beta-helix repeat-containing protein [Candidatus Heimdallarchaeota archaeon]|nr:MAG: right-handed parallel beta-helix repeat-containing protein [Candidatus Heimdallarchaeota archaeon]